MKDRYEELDSLRGIAALIVLIHHYTAILPSVESSNNIIVKLIDYTPLRLIWAGPESVTLFFVLSGFVLSFLFTRETKDRTESYLIKRICRIYIPYLIAIIFGISMNYLFSRGGIEGLSHWFNKLWTTPITVNLILNHIFFLGNYNTLAFNMSIWSLIHELRISIIFPILMWFILKFNWKWSILLAVFLSFSGLVLNDIIYNPKISFTGYTLTTNYISSLHYCSIFIFGALLAKNKDFLILKVKSLGSKTKTSLFLVGVILYCYVYVPRMILDAGDVNQIIRDYANATGAAIIIILALSSPMFSRILLKKPIHFLGKYSYSLYLYHAIVLFTLVNILYEFIWTPVLLIICTFISICLAALSYQYVEKPAIKLGKELSKKFTSQNNRINRKVKGYSMK